MSEIVKPTTLTNEQIEETREELLIDFDFDGPICERIHDLCNMARKSLDLTTALENARKDALEEAAKAVDEFSWHLPMFNNAEVNELTDDIAETIREQAATTIRSLTPPTQKAT